MGLPNIRYSSLRSENCHTILDTACHPKICSPIAFLSHFGFPWAHSCLNSAQMSLASCLCPHHAKDWAETAGQNLFFWISSQPKPAPCPLIASQWAVSSSFGSCIVSSNAWELYLGLVAHISGPEADFRSALGPLPLSSPIPTY